MSRPRKQTVDYFPHSVNHGKTLFIIEQKYGNDGYAFWFKLLEMLGKAQGHYLSVGKDEIWEYLQAKTRLSEVSTRSLLDLLSRLDAIDPELWANGVIWSQNFVDGVATVYRNRKVDIPARPSFYIEESRSTDIPVSNYTSEPSNDDDSTSRNPQSRVEESTEEEREERREKEKEECILTDQVIDYLNEKTDSSFRHSKASRKNINARLNGDGLSVDDCKLLIDYKVTEWLDNPKAAGWLNPETLFRPMKWEKNLNAAKRWDVDGRPELGGKDSEYRKARAYTQKILAKGGNSDGE